MTLRVTTVPGYVAVTAYVVEGSGPFSPRAIRDRGRPAHFHRTGDAWLATLPGMRDHTTVHYVVEATHRDGSVHYADGRLPLDKAKVFAHRVTSRRPPAWTRDTVVYQVFVDRFANADGPVPMPDDDHAFAGGDLHGVTANLDWLEDLGIDCVWLTPIFACTSYHGYDAVDLMRVEPRFGGDDALRSLVSAAHERGIRIVLDLVPNHISRDHPWFTSARSGGPERPWFFIEDDGTYQMFFSSVTMPKVNLDHPGAREAMLDVAAYWVEEFGIDGYRIDHALGPSESFFAAMSDRIEAIDPDVWLFGEVTATPELSRRYGGILDGVTDFPFAYGLREFFAGRLGADDLVEIERESAAAIAPADFSWVRFVDNHDMARAVHGWEGDPETLERALRVLFGLPGVPSVFYGTEVALSHERGEDEGGLAVGRVPMRFDRDDPMVPVVRDLIARRRASGVTPETPIFWAADGSNWEWGTLSGSL